MWRMVSESTGWDQSNGWRWSTVPPISNCCSSAIHPRLHPKWLFPNGYVQFTTRSMNDLARKYSTVLISKKSINADVKKIRMQTLVHHKVSIPTTWIKYDRRVTFFWGGTFANAFNKLDLLYERCINCLVWRIVLTFMCDTRNIVVLWKLLLVIRCLTFLAYRWILSLDNAIALRPSK